MKICLTFDDFSEQHHDIQYLKMLKQRFPGFCATMFTIPGRCSNQFLEYIYSNYPYLELAQHDFNHNFEFNGVGYDKVKELIDNGYRKQFVKIFKAQRWYLNDDLQRALKDLGYAIALDFSQGQKPIDGIKYYVHNTSHNADWNNYSSQDILSHGHMGNYASNSIIPCMDNLLKLPKDREWHWASELLLEK